MKLGKFKKNQERGGIGREIGDAFPDIQHHYDFFE